MQVITSVNSNRAVDEINPVASKTPPQRKKRSRRMPKDTRLSAVALEKIHVPRPQQSLGRTIPGVLAAFEARMNIDRMLIFIIKRQTPKEIEVSGGNLLGKEFAGGFQIRFGSYS